jgi:antitoxin component YwqK of YwqJK toxin-antitoxin module
METTDTVFNQTDNQGNKHGYWKKHYEQGGLKYKGYFEHGKPVGEMRRYLETGQLYTVMHFDTNSAYVKTRFFYQNGKPAAEGYFYRTIKDSTWKYYSYYDGHLVSTEHYTRGKKQGAEYQYYENGKVSEKITWHKDFKHGPWLQYFNDGKKKMEATFHNDQLNGSYIVYYPDGRLFVLGHYENGKRHGTWVLYNEKGGVKSEIMYAHGKAENEDELIEQDKEFFKMVEENLGKYEDPKANDMFPHGGY